MVASPSPENLVSVTWEALLVYKRGGGADYCDCLHDRTTCIATTMAMCTEQYMGTRLFRATDGSQATRTKRPDDVATHFARGWFKSRCEHPRICCATVYTRLCPCTTRRPLRGTRQSRLLLRPLPLPRAALAADRPRVALRAEQVDHDPRRQPRRRRAPRRLPEAAGRSVGPGRWNPISRAANLLQPGLPCMLR